jgi:anti-sigma-K factor RskA
MIDERTEELAALHAFDLLEGEEKAVFAARLARDPDLQALVRELRESASALACTAPLAAPAPELRARLLDKIGEIHPAGTGARLLPFRVPALLPWAVAASLAVLAAWLGQTLLATRSEADALQVESRLAQLARREAENRLAAERIVLGQQVSDSSRQLAEAHRQLADTANEVLAANQHAAEVAQQLKLQADLAQFKIATLSSMLGDSPQALAVAVWNPARQEGLLTVEKLPALAKDQDYQLWVVDPKYKDPVNGGVFTVDPDGVARVQFKPDQPITSVVKFAVTRERKGGVSKAAGPFVLLSQ